MSIVTVDEAIRLIECLSKHGVASLKLNNLEVVMAQGAVCQPEIKITEKIDPEAPVQEDDPIKHKMEQLNSLLKLGDAELVDQLFPDKQPDGIEE